MALHGVSYRAEGEVTLTQNEERRQLGLLGGRNGHSTKVTVEDVARHAGVGQGTVSRVLNGSPQVSEETRRRVNESIRDLGYRPDAAARALRRRRAGAIGAVVPFFTKHFYVEVLRSVSRATTDAGLGLIVFNVERREEQDRALTQGCVGGIVDGLLSISLVPTDEQVQALIADGRRLVLIDASHPDLSSVEVDHAHGAYLAVKHLTELGHHRIALIDRSDDPFGPASCGKRMLGFKRAFEEAGISPNLDLLVAGDYSRESGYRAMSNLLTRQDSPTAVFAASDLQAIGAMEVLKDRGLRVPEDVAVVGYNDIELAEYVGLSTVRLPTVEIGQRAVKLLCQELQDKSALPQRVVLQGELVVRQSSGLLVKRHR